MAKRVLFWVAGTLSLFVLTGFASSDAVVVPGDLRIIGAGNGLVFSDGSIQYKAQVQGPEGPQGVKGDPGASGFNSLMLLSDESPGIICQNGGIKVSVGLDQNRNGVLELNEVYQSKYVCSYGSITYSNAILTGPWLLLLSSNQNKNTYLVSDGNGVITEFGAIKASSPAGTYNIKSNGDIAMTINFVNDPPMTLTGNFISPTAAALSSQSISVSIAKVSNVSACEGTWIGTLTEQSGGTATYPISAVVNSSGVITSFTGFALPVSGKVFSEAGTIVAHFYTSEADTYQEVRLAGTLSGKVATGYFSADAPQPISGSFSLTRQ